MITHTGTKCKKRAIFCGVAMTLTLYAGCLDAAPAWEPSAAVLTAARAALPVAPGGSYRGIPPSTNGWIRACGRPLSAKVTAITRWSATVRVSCAGTAPNSASWSLYVPFQRGYTRQVILARHFLFAGAVIGRKDVRMKAMRINAQTGSVCTHMSEVVGHTLNAGVPGGYPLRPENLLSPLLVRQGERVILEARYGNILIRAMGTALEDGRAGAALLVRNNASRKVLTGVVEPDGDVLLSSGDAA
ncbi:flagellar basal body P-ring formation chaperone FlgA [Acidithiobacillus ferrooxidans]|uniref:flagellar basal body P-ring formation chaperone FlgA n=1 Tax=Acidithiobacillus ferrooxidans TaxID=920 RepID=UPI00214C40E3|nr:flagellar basal body P-ring formation chaperone FlgA [Acidithiobacillus ferrooxidans]MCR2831271.1 flagellar basal body P-ring formation chaperone FlgA [Acidithiobacillus ferrooxidans]